MAFINFEEKHKTKINFFDSNNQFLIDLLNQIDSKIRNSGNNDELIKMCKNFLNGFDIINKSNESVLDIHGYKNLDYVKYLHRIQQKFLAKIFGQINNGKTKLTKQNLEEIKEIILNNISWDKHVALFLTKKYKDAVNDIIS